MFDPATQARLDTLAQNFASKGFDLTTAQDMATKALDNVVRRESFVMAYNDAFLILGLALISCVAIVWMSKKVLGGAGAAEAAH